MDEEVDFLVIFIRMEHLRDASQAEKPAYTHPHESAYILTPVLSNQLNTAIKALLASFADSPPERTQFVAKLL